MSNVKRMGALEEACVQGRALWYEAWAAYACAAEALMASIHSCASSCEEAAKWKASFFVFSKVNALGLFEFGVKNAFDSAVRGYFAFGFLSDWVLSIISCEPLSTMKRSTHFFLSRKWSGELSFVLTSDRFGQEAVATLCVERRTEALLLAAFFLSYRTSEPRSKTERGFKRM